MLGVITSGLVIGAEWWLGERRHAAVSLVKGHVVKSNIDGDIREFSASKERHFRLKQL